MALDVEPILDGAEDQAVSVPAGFDPASIKLVGRVVGTGRHHELMADNETYREIVLSQLTEAEAA